METNLTLTAKKWQLASQLQRTASHGGVLVVKNIPERTYLTVTKRQWTVLERFAEARTVPQVLESSIEDRVCPALGEFYELVLKAVRARILVEPRQTTVPVMAANWPLAWRKRRWPLVVAVLFCTGLVLAVVQHPILPLDWRDAAAGAGFALLAWLAGMALAASLLRGAEAEVYVRRGRICLADACMLPPADQRTIVACAPAMMAATAGLLAWLRPEWSLPALVVLLVQMRPILGGAANTMIRVSAEQRLSDADHHFLFPANRTLRNRLKLLGRGLGSRETWLEIGYGICWTLLLAYFFGDLAEMPPWRAEFWRVLGPRLGVAALASLAALGLVYLGLEIYVHAREQARGWRTTLARAGRRWFGRRRFEGEFDARVRALRDSPVLRVLPPDAQHEIARVLQVARLGPWRTWRHEQAVALILSGEIGVYRRARSGRRVLAQVLAEGDLAGLHAAADPDRPDYEYRTRTPVLLLQGDRAVIEPLVLAQHTVPALAKLVRLVPFLARIPLCRSWHRQAVQRFAELSRVRECTDGETILQQGGYSDSFYVILEGDANVMNGVRRLAVVGRGGYFGEIGLLQSSNATARVVARPGARCLAVPRRDFLRFVCHNHSVAMDLERVSSQRLGRPIFPLTPGNFRTH